MEGIDILCLNAARLEIRIRPTDAGVVIGRRGENIRSMETKTNTMIHFRDESKTRIIVGGKVA